MSVTLSVDARCAAVDVAHVGSERFSDAPRDGLTACDAPGSDTPAVVAGIAA